MTGLPAPVYADDHVTLYCGRAEDLIADDIAAHGVPDRLAQTVLPLEPA